MNRKAVRKRLRRVKKTDAVLSGWKDKEGSSAGMSDKIFEEPEMLMGYQWLLVVAKCPGNMPGQRRRALYGDTSFCMMRFQEETPGKRTNL